MTHKVALISGITGQDGAYLSELLLGKGYTVHGIKRRTSLFNAARIDHLYEDPHVADPKFILHYGDLTDSMNLTRIIQEVQPDEIYNLAAMSHVKVGFDEPEYTTYADGIGTLRILEAVRLLGLTKKTRIYQASTSELYGLVQVVPQSESPPFYPRSTYAVAKLYAYWITVNYREAYGMYACNGILFNHESPLRGETFVTCKITRAAAKIVLGLQDCLYMGNIDAERDWGHAKDYVEAMYLIFAAGYPQGFCDCHRRHDPRPGVYPQNICLAGRDPGLQQRRAGNRHRSRPGRQPDGYPRTRSKYIAIRYPVLRIDPRYYRPTEVELLIGNPTKSNNQLGWKPKQTLDCLIEHMAGADLKLFQKDQLLLHEGFGVLNYFE